MTIIQFPGNKPKPITLTLPVASRQAHRIRFEPTEAKARAVPPKGALNWLEENKGQGADIRGINIEGPGDPLAEIARTLETLGLVRSRYPAMQISIATLGFNAEQHAVSLAEAGVVNVTLLVDAVTREVAEKLYAWIRPAQKTLPLSQAVSLLLVEQLLAVKAFRKAGCRVTIRTTVYPGFNDEHTEEIARIMARAGAEAMELTPCRKSSEDFNLKAPGLKELRKLQKRAARYLPTELGAEPEHQITTGCSAPQGSCTSITALVPKPAKDRPNIGVVSSNGMEIDLHLGQAYQVLIYGPREDGLACLLGTRPVPEPGSGSSRWEELAETLSDCFALLAASAGESPRTILGSRGITVIITDSEIEGKVDRLYGGKKKSCKRKMP